MFNFSIFFVIVPFVFFYLMQAIGQPITFLNIMIFICIINLILFVLSVRSKKVKYSIKVSKKSLILAGVLLIIFIYHFSVFYFPFVKTYDCADWWAHHSINPPFSFSHSETDICAKNDSDNLYHQSYYNKSKKSFYLKDIILDYESGNYCDYENSIGVVDSYGGEGTLIENVRQNGVHTDEIFTSAIPYSFALSLFNLIGFRLHYCLIMILVSAMFFYLINRIVRSEFLSYLSLLLINLNLINTIEYTSVNINFFAMLISILILYLLSKFNLKRIDVILLGVLFGLLGSLRSIAILFAPAFLIYFFFKGKKNLLYFLISSFLAIIPVLVMNQLIYGNPFYNPAVNLFSPIEHSMAGISFTFPKLLNYPFYHSLVRPIDLPFPFVVYIFLSLLNSFGILLISFILFSFTKFRKSLIGFSLISSIVFLFFLSMISYWEDGMLTLLMIILPCIILLLIVGFKNFFEQYNHKKLVLFFIFVISLLIISNLIANLDYPEDGRIDRIRYYDVNEVRQEYEYTARWFSKARLFPDFFSHRRSALSILSNVDVGDLAIRLKRDSKEVFLSPFVFYPKNSLGESYDYNILFTDENTYIMLPSSVGKSNYTLDHIDVTGGRKVEVNGVSSADEKYIFDIIIYYKGDALVIDIEDISFESTYDKIISPALRVSYDDVDEIKYYFDGYLVAYRFKDENGVFLE